MWVQFAHEDVFQAELRQIMRSALESRDYYRRPGKLHRSLAEWLVSAYGHDGYAHLRAWVLHILVSDGPDRRAETVWSSLVQHIDRRRPPLSNRLAVSMSSVKGFLNDQDDKLEVRLESQRSLPLSAWDNDVLRIHYSTAQAVDTKIALICSYNNLLAAWSYHCADLTEDELTELDAVARRVAPEAGWRDHDIPFPGNWLFDLDGVISGALANEVIPLVGR